MCGGGFDEKLKHTERKNHVLSVLNETKMHGEEQIEKREHFRYGTDSHKNELVKRYQKENPGMISAKQAEKNQKKKVKEAKALNKKYKENRFAVINDEVVDMKIDINVWENRELAGLMTPEAEAAIEAQVKEAVRLEEEAKARRKEKYHTEFEELEEEVNRCLQSSKDVGEQWTQISGLYNHFTTQKNIYKTLFEDHFMETYRQVRDAYDKSRSRNQKKS